MYLDGFAQDITATPEGTTMYFGPTLPESNIGLPTIGMQVLPADVGVAPTTILGTPMLLTLGAAGVLGLLLLSKKSR